MAQEILRCQQLADAADNKNRAIAELQPMLNRYNLWDILGGIVTMPEPEYVRG